MKKLLTIAVLAGLAVVMYNEYKKSKDSKVKLK